MSSEQPNEQHGATEYVPNSIPKLQQEVSCRASELFFTPGTRGERKERKKQEERGGGQIDGGCFEPCVLFEGDSYKELNWKAAYPHLFK